MPKPLDPSRFLARARPLTKPVLVGGTLQSGWVVGPVIAAGIYLGVCLGIVLRADPFVGLVMLPAALVIALPGAIAAAVQLARRRWMEVTANGFVVTRRDSKRRSYDDEQIIAITQQTWPRSDCSSLRRVVVEVASDEGGDVIECFYHVAANTPDPLYALVDRNVRGLAARTTDNLDKGARLSGVGWHYDRDGLHVHHGPRRGTYPLDDLAYLAYFDQQMKVYRGTDPEALFAIPQASRNADALGQILWGTMEKRPTLNDPLPGHPLGRRMHTIRGSDASLGGVMVVVGGLVAAGLGIAGVVVGGQALGLLCPAAAVAVLPAVGAWLVWRASYMRVDYHQFGVTQPGRGRSLLFRAIGAMRWTNQDVLLEPLPGAEGQTIHFQTTGVITTHDFNTVRDYIASVIAERWGREMAEKPVRWTGALRFLTATLEYTPSGVFGRGAPVEVAYGVTSYYLVQTWMELFVQGQPRAVLKQQVNAVNFYPGLVLLNWIYANLRQQQTPGQGGATLPKFTMPAQKADERFTGGERNVTPGE